MAEIKLRKKLIYAGDAYRAILDADPKLAYCIERIKGVDAVEARRGRWVSSGCGFDVCSECRKVYADGYLTAMGIKPRVQFNYCPNCGADMRGNENG